jgi:hypothetical protein
METLSLKDVELSITRLDTLLSKILSELGLSLQEALALEKNLTKNRKVYLN